MLVEALQRAADSPTFRLIKKIREEIEGNFSLLFVRKLDIERCQKWYNIDGN